MEAWRSQFKELMLLNSKDWEMEEEFQERVIFGDSISMGSLNSMNSQNGQFYNRRVKDRNRVHGHEMIWNDYFANSPTFTDRDFHRHFRMSKRLFSRILADIPNSDVFFVQKRDAANKLGLSPLQKVTAAIRQLAYGYGSDATDEYCRIGESTARSCLYRFCSAIRDLYEDQYLRKPTPTDFARVLATNQSRGFPGMFGSLDCMHYEWTNCPVDWHGQFLNKDGRKSLILEAVVDGELWFWHAFFGLPGGNNDINVLDRSPLVYDLIHGKYDDNSFSINGEVYSGAYLLVDGIYPKWSCFIPSIQQPQSEKNKLFAKAQEAMRKDVERAFGVLQGRWSIIRQHARSWHLSRIIDILLACIILHNMIIEDERGEHHDDFYMPPAASTMARMSLPWQDYLNAVTRVESTDAHFRLRNSLIEHLWAQKGRCHEQ